MFCTMMKMSAVMACMPRKTGVMKASPMKPPIGSTSSLMIVAVSDDLTVRRASGREAQDHGEQVEAHAPQHPLAEHALGDVDPVLERAVDDDEEQEQAGQAEQQAEPADLEALEDLRTCRRRASSGSSKPRLRKGAVVLPSLKALPWIAWFTIWRGRSRDMK